MSGLIFRSLIRFEFIICMALGSVPISFFYKSCLVLPAPIIEETVFFSIVYSCLPFHRLGDYRCVGLSLGFLSCTIDL